MDSQSRDYGIENNKNLRLVIGLTRSNKELIRSFQQQLLRFGITLPQFEVLEALYHLGDLKISEIIEKILSTSGNMTVVIRNLEKESFVIREQTKEDKRVSLISLTEKGRGLVKKVFPEHLEFLSRQFRHLTEEDKDELIRLIRKMNRVD